MRVQSSCDVIHFMLRQPYMLVFPKGLEGLYIGIAESYVIYICKWFI
jgi:hypothetical protein